MPRKNSGDIPKRLEALVAEIEAVAYERGRADARKMLLDALAPEGARPSGPSGRRGTRARKKAVGGRKRAPKGTVPRFVERVLREHPGLTPHEILARAATDDERSVPLASIRTRLHIGRARGRYVASSGRWSLAGLEADEAVGDQVTGT